MNSVEGLSWSMIGLFVPLYFLSLGYSLEIVFVYYIIQNLVILLASFLALYLGKHISLQKILIIRFPILLSFLYLLYNLSSAGNALYVLAILDGIQAAFFYFPLHVIFAKFVHKTEMEKETAKLMAIPQAVTMFGPLIGGFVVLVFGFKVLFALACILFVIEFLPILDTKIVAVKYKIDLKTAVVYYRKHKKYFFAEIVNNISEEIEGVIWPIFVYVSLLNVASVGAVGSLLAISTALFTYIIGKVLNKKNKLVMMKVSVFFIAIVWLLRFVFAGEMIFYVLTVLSGLAYTVFSVPYYSKIYSRAKRENTAVFFAFREIPIAIARVAVFVLAIIFAEDLKMLFPIAGLVYVYFLFWREK